MVCSAGWKVKSELAAWALPCIVSVCLVTVLFCGFVVVSHLKKSCVVSIKDARYNIDRDLAAAIIV